MYKPANTFPEQIRPRSATLFNRHLAAAIDVHAQVKPAHWNFSRRAVHSINIIGAAGIALLASANILANAGESPGRMTEAQYACAVVMGLHRPGDLYDTCIRSLSRSLSEWEYARSVSTDRNQCERAGLQPGTPAFAVCVVKTEQPPADTGGHEPVASFP